MIPQLKFICIVLSLLMVPGLAGAQEQQNILDQNRIDSIQQLLSARINRQLNQVQARFQSELNAQRILVDSLISEVNRREAEIVKLESKSQELTQQLARTNQSVIANRSTISAEKERFRRMFLISGFTLLTLVLVITLLYFLMLMRHTEQTEQKISALRKYTYQEIEVTRNSLIKKIKKQVNKLRTKLPKEKKTGRKKRRKK
ncbi:MAG: hypothetical protein WD052_10020 [Bacteroidales bacterium]